jgi:hypothetical protein
MEDDPVLFMLKADQLEARDTDDGTVTAWEGHLWIGKDLNKLWIKTEGERSSEGTESAEFQLLYSRAIDANWDLQVGLRHDADPDPERNWAVIGFNGVSPYWFEIDSALFIEEDEQVNLRFEAEYEFMLTLRSKSTGSARMMMNWESVQAWPRLKRGSDCVTKSAASSRPTSASTMNDCLAKPRILLKRQAKIAAKRSWSQDYASGFSFSANSYLLKQI